MSSKFGVEGFGGNSGFGVGGKIGDVSGFGVGGKIGDVSGLPVGGKIGDVSGGVTFEQVQDLVLRDRNVSNLECLEAKVNRLEYEILSIARWLDLRIRALEGTGVSGGNGSVDLQRLDGRVRELAGDISTQKERLDGHQTRIQTLEQKVGIPSPTPTPTPT